MKLVETRFLEAHMRGRIEIRYLPGERYYGIELSLADGRTIVFCVPVKDAAAEVLRELADAIPYGIVVPDLPDDEPPPVHVKLMT